MKHKALPILLALTLFFGGCGDQPQSEKADSARVESEITEITDSVTTEAIDAKATEAIKEDETMKPTAAALSDKIDVTPFPGFSFSGEWQFSSALKGPMTKSAQTMWLSGAKETDYCIYDPEIAAVGDVRISVYLLYWKESQCKDVKYEVHHNGKIDEFHLDPTELTESKWVTLGTFDFAGKGDELVKLVGTNNGGNTRASAVAFEIINSAQSGDVWQTVFIAPSRAAVESQNLKSFSEQQAELFGVFSDISGIFAEYKIVYLANEGIIPTSEDKKFNPDSTITADELSAMLAKILDSSSLPEIKSDSLTRAQLALLLSDAAENYGTNPAWVDSLPEVKLPSDAEKLSPELKSSFAYLMRAGVLDRVDADSALTRADAADALYNFLQNFVIAGPPTNDEWELTFNDEFLGDSLDWDTWESQSGYPSHILSSRWPENAVVRDGTLRLENRKESRGGAEWTSGNVWVKPSVFRQAYGYWEARYKLSEGSGINNSFWMITTNQPGLVTSERQHFELDVCEGHYPNKVNTNYHSWHSGKRVQHSEQLVSDYDLSQEFHTYALEWNEDELIYYFDGKPIHTKKNENASIPLFPYLSGAVLNWAGEISDAADGSAMVVDYVRVWQRKK